MNVDQNQTPITYFKSKPDKDKSVRNGKKNNLKVVAALLGILIFIGGAVSVFLISQKQDTTPIAPNVPQSQPAAYIEKTQTCTLEFVVKGPDVEPDKIACGASNCATDSDCDADLKCVLVSTPDSDATDSATTTIGYCSQPDYVEACAADPNETSCCTAPEPEPLACGEDNCVTTDDCEDGLVCISTAETDSEGNIVKYCADDSYLDACVADPSTETCCTAPTVTVTATPTDTIIPTVTVTNTVTPTDVVPINTIVPTVTTVVTTVNCNDTCSANADCSNISHICYQGHCRLDVNPTDAACRLPSGETTIVRPVKVPTTSGPADWMNYVKAGLGTLGVGALLLLLL